MEPDPETAFAIALDLNDRFEMDGRDRTATRVWHGRLAVSTIGLAGTADLRHDPLHEL